MADVAEDSEAAGNPRVNLRTRVGVFEVENLSRVPGYAYPVTRTVTRLISTMFDSCGTY